MTKPLRDYTKIKQKNYQEITNYGMEKFVQPCDVTMGSNDEVIILNFGTKEVIILDKDRNLITKIGQGNGDSKLKSPMCVALGGNVIAVSDDGDDVVKKYSLQGDYLSKFGSSGTTDGHFDGPQGLCFNSQGLLYVVDYNNGRVQVFRENVFKFKFGSKGHNPGRFQKPRCIAVDSNDQLYVTDSCDDGGIYVFSEDGRFMKKINCKKPFSIGIAPDDYIITHDDNYVLTVFSPTHELIAKLGVHDNKKRQFNYIFGIAIDSSGTIFVTAGRNNLQVITF